MTETLSTGLLLLFVGMGTVFCVLWIVVATGKLLIVAVNRFAIPGDHPLPPDARHPDPSGAKIAAITSAVEAITGGKGQITHIERLES